MRRVALAAATLVFAAPAAAQMVTPGCRIGSFYAVTSTFAFDADGNGAWSAGDRQMTIDVAGGPGTPIVGDWNGDGFDDAGKQVGTWYRIDLDGDGVWEGNPGGDRNANFGGAFGAGIALAGDWNGDGRDEIGTYVPDTGEFLLDANGNGVWDGSAGGDAISWFASFALQFRTARPLIGDWNGDGVDDVGTWSATNVFVDVDGDRVWEGSLVDRTFSVRILETDPGAVFSLDWDHDGADEVGGRSAYYGGGPARFWVDELGTVPFLDSPPGVGSSLACDWDGDGGGNLGRVEGEVFRLDANGNGTWDGNAGGDLEMGFVPPAGVGAPIAGRWAPPPP